MPMGKSAVAFGLAGLAAAGVVLSAARGSVAAPANDAALEQALKPCAPGRVGQAVEIEYRLRVGGVAKPRRALKPGVWVETDSSGAAVICLKRGAWRCTLVEDTRVRVLPKQRVLLRVQFGSVSCATPRGGSEEIETGRKESLTIADPTAGAFRSTQTSRQIGADSSATATGGRVFSLRVSRGRTVAKVQRGVALLARLANRERAVVVGRRQQSQVTGGRDPSPPTVISLSATERGILRQLEQKLPAETDQKAPTVNTGGPRDPSSVRKATLNFSASENALFSCALDGGDFRVCSSPQQFERLRPGRHTFAVKATDSAGNTRQAQHTWTVDGSLIAFTSERDGNLEIYVMEPDGFNQVRLTNNSAADEDPDWSSDRRKIAFHSERDQNAEIYVMNADGSGQTRLTSHPATDRNPSWSPDGSRIAFESFRDGNREIYVMNADGSNQRRLTNHSALDFDPAWSPDGAKIAFASTRDDNYEIYVMSTDGSGVARLTDNSAVEFNPAWSPDGRRIAFHSLRSLLSQQIYVMSADGSNVVRLTKSDANDENPAWSPDGDWIVFQSGRDEHPRTEIYMVKADGTEETRLTKVPGSDLVPDW